MIRTVQFGDFGVLCRSVPGFRGAMVVSILSCCRRPAMTPSDSPSQNGAIELPGAANDCNAIYEIPLEPSHCQDPMTPTPASVVMGTLHGSEAGICAHGLNAEGAWYWFIQPSEAAFRGTLRCVAGQCTSPEVRIGPKDTPVPAGVRGEFWSGTHLESYDEPRQVGDMRIELGSLSTIDCPGGAFPGQSSSPDR